VEIVNIGDIIESAIWLTGEESLELRKRYKRDVIESIDYLCQEQRYLHGQIQFTEKKPGQDRVPEVPDHIQGINVRLLVAEAEVVGKAPETSIGSFTANLDRVDLDRLRAITRRIRLKLYKQRLTDEECDEVIEELGPEAALDTLRKQTKPFGILH
jgi:hypothetical protein